MTRHVSVLATTALLLAVSACDTSEQNPTAASGPSAAVASNGVIRRDLGTLGGRSSFATDLNGSGTVVGWSNTATGIVHAFKWTGAGGMVDLGTLPGDVESAAYAINSAGDIIGTSRSPGGSTPVIWNHLGGIQPIGIAPVPGELSPCS